MYGDAIEKLLNYEVIWLVTSLSTYQAGSENSIKIGEFWIIWACPSVATFEDPIELKL